MGCPRERVAVLTLFIASLFLLSCQVGIVSCEAKHRTRLNVRRLLDTSAGGDSRGDAPVVYAAEQTAAAAAAAAAPTAEDCSLELVKVSQDSAGHQPNGVPSYRVTITNTCLGCTVRDVHVSCGEFASTVLVRPSDFRRLAYGDCLVREGGPIASGEVVSFEYSNSFNYSLDVKAVSCSDF